MYELGEPLLSLTNLAFSVVGVWMAHSLYRATRKRWQVVLAWGLAFLSWGVGANVLQYFFPTVSYLRLSMLVGLSGIFVYLYLFGDVPVQQRVFSYFMVDTAMNLLVLFPRVSGQLVSQFSGLPLQATFLCFYLPMMGGFLWLFKRFMRDYIHAVLQAFQSHLMPLTVFAATAYLTLVLAINPWGVWNRLTLWEALCWYSLMAFVVVGYVLCFRTLMLVMAKNVAHAEAIRLSQQIVLTEKYYDLLTKQLQANRIRVHDLRHHNNVLMGLCRDNDFEGVKRYVSEIAEDVPDSTYWRYTDNNALNVLINHYAESCRKKGIRFSCQMRLPEEVGIATLHLCVVFGNALRNAAEALEGLDEAHEKWMDVQAVYKKDRLAITIANACDPALVLAEFPSTSKREAGHGLGLVSIQEIVKRYHGWCGVDAKNGIFTLQAVMKSNPL